MECQWENEQDMIAALRSRRNEEGYQALLRAEQLSAQSNGLYGYFGEFLELLNSKSAFVRVRGFRLACAQAQWDTENKIEEHLDVLLNMLDDERPTAVRQCLSALRLVVLYKPGLMDRIEGRLNEMDLSKYKDSMGPLIKKDMDELRQRMA